MKVVTNFKKNGFIYLDIDLNKSFYLRQKLDHLLASLEDLKRKDRYVEHLDNTTIYKMYKSIYDFGSSEFIKNLIDTYAGKELTYRGIDARVDFNDNSFDKTRYFHIDHDGLPTVKLIIYLNDTIVDGGGFTIVKRRRALSIFYKIFGEKLTYIILKYIPVLFGEQELSGKKYSMLLVDTTKLWHKGALPKKNRYSIFFSYSGLGKFPADKISLLQDVDKFTDDSTLSYLL